MEALLFLLIWFAFPSKAQLRSCYNVDHNPSLDFPCDPSAIVSSCCSSGGRCATNLYCISPLGASIVGTCTDRTFTDKACPWPLGKASATPNFDHFDYKLNTTTCSDGTICPSQSDPQCCSAGRGKVEINFHNNAVIPSASRDLVSYYSAAGYTIAATTSAIAASTTITRNTDVPSRTSSSGTISSPASSIPASTSPSSTTTASPNTSSSLSTGAKVGIGIGAVALAVLAIAVLIFFLRRRRNQTNVNAQSSPQESQGIMPSEEPRAGQGLASELPAERIYPPLVEMESPDNPRKTLNAPNQMYNSE